MALENLKSAFSNIIVPDLEEYDPNIGGIHGGTPSQPSHPPSHTAEMETAFGTIGTNLSQHGERHGGISAETPSQPPHPETHSGLDSKVGSFGNPQYAGVVSGRGPLFPFNYSPEIGGIHGLRSPQPPHSTQHSTYDVGVGRRGVPQYTGMRTDSQITFPIDYDPDIGGIHGDRNPQPHQTEAHSAFDNGVGTFGQPQYAGVKSDRGIAFPTDYEPDIGGLFGGMTTATPSFPVHKATYSAFDNGVGTFGQPQYAGVKSDRGIAFPTDYDPNVGGIHGLRSPQPPHSVDHSTFDKLKHRLGFGPGTMNFDRFGPSAFENMTSAEFSPIWNFADPDIMGSRGSSDQEINGLYGLVTGIASKQQRYAVNSPWGIGGEVKGQIVFTRTPLAGDEDQTAHMNGLPPSMLEVDFLKGGESAGNEFHKLSPGGNYSYASLRNYATALDGLSPTIEGFTEDFDSYGYSVDTPEGSSKYLNSAGIVIGSGLAPKSKSNYASVFEKYGSGIIKSHVVDFLKAGYSYAGMGGYLLETPPTISGFDQNFDSSKFLDYPGPGPAPKILNIDNIGSPAVAIGSGLASKSHKDTVSVKEEYGTGRLTTHLITLFEKFTFEPNFNTLDQTIRSPDDSPSLLTMRSGYDFTSKLGTTTTATGLISMGRTVPVPDDPATPQIDEAIASKTIKSYNAATYDWRTKHGTLTSNYQGQVLNTNLYQGTMFDDPLIIDQDGGGLFTTIGLVGVDKYSTTFRTIDGAPKGFEDATASNKNIFIGGNMGSVRGSDGTGAAKAGSPFLPSGYSGTILDSWNKWQGARGSKPDDFTWFYSGESLAIPNVSSLFTANSEGLDTSGGNKKRSVSFNGNVLTSERLGEGDLTFSTLYHHDHADGHRTDDRLKIRYVSSLGTTLRSSITGGEPYYVTPIGGDDRFLFKTGWSSRAFPLGRATQDLTRLAKWQFSGAGLFSLVSQFAQQYLNPRNKRIYNPLSLGSGISLGAGAKFRMDRGWLFSKDVYTDQIEELRDPNAPTDDVATGLQKLRNALAFKIGGEGTSGGIRYQVLGDNAEGETDFSSVAPKPLDPLFSPANIGSFFRIDHRSSLTRAASAADTRFGGQGIGGNTNPRKLFSDIIKFDSVTQTTNADLSGAEATELKFETPPRALYENTPEHDGAGDFVVPYNIVGSQRGKDSSGNPLPGLNDIFTTAPIQKEETSQWKKVVEDKSNGMPFYIKDLRDGNYIVFRAYIDGIDETITPGWESENYIGRSEPVYTYGPTERAISMNLKLFAQTSNELDLIYQKLNRVTSLCYPEYQKDVRLGDKTRMKPPIIQFRLGELFGSGTRDMTGFITSLTYTYEDDSPWETEQGRRVPKYVTAALGFQVIHEEVPSLDFSRHQDHEQASDFRFYGINDTVGVGVQAATS